ncbi:MAG: PKD domain-containing protein, partial [Planctomycetota bacterium]
VVSEPPPVAEFIGAPTSGVLPLVVDFTNQSSGSITTHAWSFGDGGTSSAASPSHTYTAAGTYTVALTETGPGGANTRTRTSYIVVSEPPPVADFLGAPLTGTAPLLVDFTDLSSGTITSWAWDFGDGNSSNASSTSNTYTQPGIFPVSLTVSGPGGTDTLTRASYVFVDAPAPTADFSAAPLSGPAPLAVTFSDASSGLIDSWVWDFGDGAQAFDPFTGHNYTLPGTYTVTLTITGPGGSDSETKFALIDVQPPQVTASFVAFPTEGTAPLVVQFQDTSSGGATSWNWDFGDGISESSQHPSHTYSSPGTYSVGLTINGGASSAGQSILVHVAAEANVRNGSGVNPLVYQSSLPILGQTWTGSIDASGHPGAGLTMVLVRAQPSGGIASPYGEILYNPASPKLFTSIALSGGATAFHSGPIPLDLAFEGLTATTQGVIFGGAGAELTNAVDLVLGF